MIGTFYFNIEKKPTQPLSLPVAKEQLLNDYNAI